MTPKTHMDDVISHIMPLCPILSSRKSPGSQNCEAGLRSRLNIVKLCIEADLAVLFLKTVMHIQLIVYVISFSRSNMFLIC